MNETIHLERGRTDLLAPHFGKLGLLEDGWMDGVGKAPAPEELAWLSEQFALTFPAGLPLPFLCLTPTGGVFMEWTHGDWTVSAEFPIPERRCELQATNTKTRETRDEERPLTEAADFAAIYRFAGRFAGSV